MNPETPKKVAQILVENLPKWRDGTLVLAGLAYVLGYLSWGYYAYSHGLGLAPVLDAQYFAAGVLPATIVIASCFVAWWLLWLGQWIQKPVSDFGKRVKTILELTGVLVTLTGFILLLVSKRVARIPNAFATVYFILFFVGMIAFLVSSLFSRGKADTWYHRFLMGTAWVYLPFVGVTAFSLYTTKIFPGLPQAFGGPRPQCVQLDVDVSKVSTDTLHLLAPESQSGQSNHSLVVRSRNLYLIFQSSEYLFLQTSRQTSPTTNQVFKVKNSTVESLFPVAE